MKKNKRDLIYLAAPYTYKGKHTGYEVLDRVLKINRASAEILLNGNFVYSPISHNHPIKETCPDTMNGGWHFWREFDLRMLSLCDKMYILTLPEWHLSMGVSEEIKFALKHKKPIFEMSPADYSIVEFNEEFNAMRFAS